MDNYKCLDCGDTFEDPVTVEEKVGEWGDSLPPGYLKYDACPLCGSYDIEDLKEEKE